MKKTKTFTLKVNYRAWDLLEFALSGNAGVIDEQLTKQANLTLGKNNWYASHFQALEKENGDMVFKMRVVFGK